MKDKLRHSAVIRQLEIIGEATKNIPDSLRKKHPNTPWKEIAGMRDVLIHTYFGADMEKVWNTVKDDLPKLKEDLKKIFTSLNENADSTKK